MSEFRELNVQEMTEACGGLKLGVSGNIFLDIFLAPIKLFVDLFLRVRI